MFEQSDWILFGGVVALTVWLVWIPLLRYAIDDWRKRKVKQK